MSDEAKIPIVLLCAPSGTGLTAIAGSLGALGSQIEVEDLENRVCEMHNGASMEQVVRLPRPVLYESWRVACNGVLNDIVEAEEGRPKPRKRDHSTSSAVVSMHLTWFNPDTSEFFSPVDPLRLQRTDCRIVHVVILIDDIYDMFCRLQGDLDLYSDRNMAQHRDMLAKLAPELNQPGLQAYAVEIALGELIAWRRAEMIHAENLAKSLGARFTVLGTKHHRRALEILVARPDAPRIYLSHRITEPRRHNSRTRTKRHRVGTWLPIADEVNALHAEFTSPDRDVTTEGQVLVTPTAIDELRFDHANKQGRRNPFLGPRWPMLKQLEQLLWSIPAPRPDSATQAEHTGILTGHTDPLSNYPKYPRANPVSRSVAALLANRIFFEIAFRDHVIVENTPNLCAFRPFFGAESDAAGSGADWSSGVKREIEHWEDSQKLHGEDIPTGTIPRDLEPRLIAFVHTEKEIVDRFKWLEENSEQAVFVSYVTGHLRERWEKSGIPSNEINELLSGSIPSEQATQLGRRPDESVVAQRPREVFDAIEPAVQTALHFIFTSLLRPSSEEDDAEITSPLRLHQVALVAVKESDGSVLGMDRLVSDLSTFFSGVLDANAVKVLNDVFWRTCEECFRSYRGVELNQHIAELVGLPYAEIRDLARR